MAKIIGTSNVGNQVKHLDENKYLSLKLDEELEINRPHDAGCLYNFLINYKFQKALESLPFPIKGLSVLDICCGSGMISEFYVREEAEVTGIDISDDCIRRAKIRAERYEFSANFRIGDSKNLPFPGNSFDIVSVHDGLHHLDNPKEAVKEMTRLARRGVIIIEPAKALITELSILLGVSLKYEGADFVYRFKKDELTSWLKEFGIKKVLIKRYIMYYPHKPGRFFRIFDNAVVFYIAKKIFEIVNMLFGKFGNKVQVIGLK